MKTLFTSFFCGMLLWTTSLATPSTLLLTYENLSLKVENHNPQLQAAREKILIAQGRVIQSTKRKNPSLSLGIEASSNLGEGRLTAGIEQEFPLTQRLTHQYKKSKWEVKAAEAEVLIAQRKYLIKARSAYIKHHFLGKKKALLTLHAESLEELSSFLIEAAKKAEADPLEATQAELEAAQFIVQAETLSLEEELLEHELRSVMGLSSETVLQLAESLPESLDSLRSPAPENIPEFQLQHALIEAAAQGVIIEEAKRYGDLTLEAFTSIGREEDFPSGMQHDFTIGLGVKVPFPFWDKNEGNISAAQAEKRAEELHLKALKKNLLLKASTLEKQVSLHEQHIHNLREKLLPQAETQGKKLLDAYKNGQSPFPKYLKSQETILSLHLRLLEEEEKSTLLKVHLQSLSL